MRGAVPNVFLLTTSVLTKDRASWGIVNLKSYLSSGASSGNRPKLSVFLCVEFWCDDDKI